MYSDYDRLVPRPVSPPQSSLRSAKNRESGIEDDSKT